MKRITVISIILLLGCASSPIHGNYGDVNRTAIDASLIELIATPTAYDNKCIRVSGVISFDFEGTALYLTQEHFKNGITDNAVWIDIDGDQLFKGYDRSEVIHDLKYFQGKYVTIEGIFSSNGKGHLSLFKGSINVSRIF